MAKVNTDSVFRNAKSRKRESPYASAMTRIVPKRAKTVAKAVSPAPAAPAADSPTMRLFSLLETIAAKDRLVSLQGLVDETGWPKPSMHRMLQQLEGAGLLLREGDGRHYSSGPRLRRLAESLLMHSSHHGARHRVLRSLVDKVGESCNITALAGSEVMYLDRVETHAPLRFYLQPGSRVPLHCSASGKMFLAQMSPAQRQRLLAHVPLERCTAKTITELAALELELKKVRKQGYAIDDEEFLPGLVCVAVLVPSSTVKARSTLCIAAQAPVVRLTAATAPQLLPALQAAAAALAAIDAPVLPPRPIPKKKP